MGPANRHCIGFALENDTPFDIVLSIASTTHVDRHGEQFSEDSIKNFVEQIKEVYRPLLFNHSRATPPIGALVSAKSFRFPDKELGVATLTVFYTQSNAWQNFPVGEPNTKFDEYLPFIDIELVLKKHDELVGDTPDEPITIAEALDAYLDSHIVMDNGQLLVRKYNVATVKDFQIILHPGDHPPAHFHAISLQRGIDASFNIETLELYRENTGGVRNKDVKLIQSFFRNSGKQYQKLKQEAKRLKVGVAEIVVTT